RPCQCNITTHHRLVTNCPVRNHPVTLLHIVSSLESIEPGRDERYHDPSPSPGGSPASAASARRKNPNRPTSLLATQRSDTMAGQFQNASESTPNSSSVCRVPHSSRFLR